MSLYYGISLVEERGTFCALDGAEVPDVAHWQYDDEDLDIGIPPICPDYGVAPSPSCENQEEQLMDTGMFVKTYDGCAETFLGGETFMDQFRNDQYVEQHWENIYFPWASRQEWVFASWLLQSCLSMAAMNSLLSLEIISNDISIAQRVYGVRAKANTCLKLVS
ncbi:hypothetical protein BKA83DRAFT_4494638 [Pisolithus microcarpus]|nr:hypothetical protein BKA83DRAFT_4494638 [Pisolithus microcarpus]